MLLHHAVLVDVRINRSRLSYASLSSASGNYMIVLAANRRSNCSRGSGSCRRGSSSMSRSRSHFRRHRIIMIISRRYP